LTGGRTLAILGGVSSHLPRIVSLFPAATEMVCGLGLEAQLVGVSHACHWPPSVAALPKLTSSHVDSAAPSGAIDVQVRSLLRTGESLYAVDERLLEDLRPDLIITQAHCDVCAVSLHTVERVLAKRPGLSQARLLSLNPQSFAEVLQDMQRIGNAAHASAAAKVYLRSLCSRIDAVEAAATAGGGRPRPRVAVIEWIDPLMIAGNWTPELVELAGGEYALAMPGKPSPLVDWREIVHFGPELLVIAPCGFDEDRARLEAQQLQSRPAWKSLPAVERGQVHIVDGDAYFNCPGPRLVDALEWLAAAIQDVMI
jgi:iron complex transport system substrate-binding protein